MSGQLSLFSAELQPPSYDDLEGVLVGPAQLAHRPGAARLSVPVPAGEPWRLDPIGAGLAAVGLTSEVVSSDARGGFVVRTEFTPRLVPLATRWRRGAMAAAPADLRLDGPRLRWWCLVAGGGDATGYLLGLGGDAAMWSSAGAALAAVGVPATFVRPRSEERPGERRSREAYRVVGARRLTRLAELVGPAPHGWPPGCWPDR